MSLSDAGELISINMAIESMSTSPTGGSRVMRSSVTGRLAGRAWLFRWWQVSLKILFELVVGILHNARHSCSCHSFVAVDGRGGGGECLGVVFLPSRRIRAITGVKSH